MVDVICLGASVVDVPLQPVDKKVFKSESYPLENISLTTGGDALNEATIISRLGSKVKLISMVGNDIAGKFILNHCRNNLIDIDGITVKDGINTSINIGLVAHDGERTFITSKNGSLWKTTIDDLNLDLIKDAKILSYGSFFNNPLLRDEELVKILSRAKQQNMIITADMIKPRNNETFDDIKNSLKLVDFFFPNIDEARLMTNKNDINEIADDILSYGVKCVVIKIDSKGAYIKNESGFKAVIPAMHGITAIDTIGAGDNFASGFITGLVEGLSIKECTQMANVAAGISIQSLGATSGIKTRKQFNENLNRYFIQEGEKN
ncbi:carbohydrate kinase family protein [Anaerococcus sp. AGMB00486]|uniref:Carbohydrate kinase family protein n=1 Tax=Anaerococcus faecalis TaxID=2742993 RepID=A0ABX2N8W0_9FIRM|nr:carbohydrate kinase family protein [Anaerococcus faecalis]NVF11119.1 carbohydrate kinase family protein [Anaerococcus faecalis]